MNKCRELGNLSVMEPIDNNQFEVKPMNSKRKIATPCPNVYLNPALDLLVNEDPMCNTAMEISFKKRKRTQSCEITTFENSALDLGISKAAVNEFLVRELENVRKNLKCNDIDDTRIPCSKSVPKELGVQIEPVYANLNDISTPHIENVEIVTQDMNTELSRIVPEDLSKIDSGISVLEKKSLITVGNEVTNDMNISEITNIHTNVHNQVFINNPSNLSLSFIDRLALDSPNASNQSLYLDDDLNESNIMEIKTITIITKMKRFPERRNTNPFLNTNLKIEDIPNENPFLEITKPEVEYSEEVKNRPVENQMPNADNLVPRRLFSGDTNSTISTVNESSMEIQHEYENMDTYRAESPIYENLDEPDSFNKQSKILGYDVSQFSAVDIMNLNKNRNHSNESSESKKDLKHQLLKAGNKLSRKVFKTLKKTFKHEKTDNNVTLNPYEVPRKVAKPKTTPKDSGIENPALNLDNSDDIDIEEIDEEHQYETVKTIRNTRLNMNVTPLKERDIDNIDLLHNRTNTPGKKVRFDSTLNQEKVITGDSFNYDIQSPGFDSKIDKYHDELENCINERKFLQQNM